MILRQWPRTPWPTTPRTHHHRRCRAPVTLADALACHPANAQTRPCGTERKISANSSPSKNWRTERTSSALPTMRTILRTTDPCCCKSRTRIRRTAVFPIDQDVNLNEITTATPRCPSTKMRSLKNRLAAKLPSQEVEMEAPTQQHIQHRRLTGTHQPSMLMDRKWGSCQKEEERDNQQAGWCVNKEEERRGGGVEEQEERWGGG